jgi:hypothetical protein
VKTLYAFLLTFVGLGMVTGACLLAANTSGTDGSAFGLGIVGFIAAAFGWLFYALKENL